MMKSLLLAAATFGSTSAETFAGYLADIYCAKMCTDTSPSCAVLDGADMMRQPQDHTVHCLYDMQQCWSSGFCLLKNVARLGEAPQYKCSVFLDQDLTDNVVMPYLNALRENGQEKDVWVSVSGNLKEASAFQDTMRLVAECDMCKGPQVIGTLQDFKIEECEINNGGCPSDMECVEEEMFCIDQPCPKQTFCVDGHGDMLLATLDHAEQGGTGPGTDNTVNAVSWSPNGGWIASAGVDGKVILWESETGIPTGVQNPRAYDGSALDAEWVGEGGIVVAPAIGGPVVFSPVDGSLMSSWQIPASLGRSTLSVAVIEDNSPTKELDGHIISTHPAGVAIWSPSGEIVAQWNNEIGMSGETKFLQFFTGTNVGNYGIVAHNGGASFITVPGARDGGPNLETPDAPRSMSVGLSSENVAICTNEGTVEIWELGLTGDGPMGHKTRTITPQELGGAQCNTVAFSPAKWMDMNGKVSEVLAIGTKQGDGPGMPVPPMVHIIPVSKGSGGNNPPPVPFPSLVGHDGDITDIAWHPYGDGSDNILATASTDGKVKIWEVPMMGYYAVGDSALTPIPNKPPMAGPAGCFAALSSACPADNQDLCQQCTNSLGFILKRAGCTDTDFAEYCVNSLPCDQALKEVRCLGTTPAATTSSCLRCAAEKQTQLDQMGCTSHLVAEECQKLVADPAKCLPALQEVCGEFAGQGDLCFACLSEDQNVALLEKNRCSYNTTATFCEGTDAPTRQCNEVLDGACGQVMEKGSECFSCLAQNQDTIRRANCANKQLQEFCATQHAPPPPPEQKCTQLLETACQKGPPPVDQNKCLRCVSSKLSQLLAQCTNDNIVSYCIS